MALLGYVECDYNDPATFEALKQGARPHRVPVFDLAFSPALLGG